MENSKQDEIIELLNGVLSRFEYLETMVTYNQDILGSFHPDPVVRSICQGNLKIAGEEACSDYTINRLRERYPTKELGYFLREILKEAVQKLDTVAIKEVDEIS